MHQKILVRHISSSPFLFKNVVPSNLKGKGSSSTKWLTRQLRDPYVDKAKMMNYRCRSAFKLLEIDDRFKILSPGHTVVDCGAAPGSWSQVAVSKVNADASNSHESVGTVISVDRQYIFPIVGANILSNADFTIPHTQERITKLLNNKKADVILSDMAPNATGVKEMDDENILKLCYMVLRFAILISKPKSTLLMKLWQTGNSKKLENDVLRFYTITKFVKPQASRSDSAEVFLLAQNFKGLKTG